jgi:hypothetical protein
MPPLHRKLKARPAANPVSSATPQMDCWGGGVLRRSGCTIPGGRSRRPQDGVARPVWSEVAA